MNKNFNIIWVWIIWVWKKSLEMLASKDTLWLLINSENISEILPNLSETEVDYPKHFWLLKVVIVQDNTIREVIEILNSLNIKINPINELADSLISKIILLPKDVDSEFFFKKTEKLIINPKEVKKGNKKLNKSPYKWQRLKYIRQKVI